MRKPFLPALLSIFLGLGLAAFAQRQPGQAPQPQPGQAQPPSQQPGQSPAQQERDREQPGAAQRVTLTGCLAKSGAASQYSITDKDSKQKVTFPGPAQLDAYVNQTVKLMGSMETKDTGEKVFRPESISPVSPSCA
jgi:hypothetical protein